LYVFMNGLTEPSYLIDLTEGYEGLVGEDWVDNY
jgi:hypothetical protein